MTKIIEVSHLNFGYNDNLILKDISFSVDKGDYLGIIGANGTGKSTLIKLLLKIMDPLSGEMKLLGENINVFKRWDKIGYVSQKANSFNNSFPATVEEVVAANLYSKIGLLRFPNKSHMEQVYHALELVGMKDYSKRLIGNLSGGQQQRVFIARVLVNEPEILFLDEPLVGIDARSEEAVYGLLAKLNQELGLTIVMVTHDISAITIHANKLLCLGENGMFMHDPKEGINAEFATELYGYSVNLHNHDCQNCYKGVS
ncbi:metal ABC transporter ATP-binding protein [Desulfitobacterium sp.]|uniref:metal ABC transporter ATP-binding protein n=1 Tax=Desulfitobacterium sp. TaxID=49981 RepID=UPI002BBE7A7C|nr:metal ABC transporter ATP-binding protein [Desulfitobacterium sp.]HVJ49376.1 metal ABC transporter ATP-binding protein [Desulfitobacterium sp.]